MKSIEEVSLNGKVFVYCKYLAALILSLDILKNAVDFHGAIHYYILTDLNG